MPKSNNYEPYRHDDDSVIELSASEISAMQEDLWNAYAAEEIDEEELDDRLGKLPPEPFDDGPEDWELPEGYDWGADPDEM